MRGCGVGMNQARLPEELISLSVTTKRQSVARPLDLVPGSGRSTRPRLPGKAFPSLALRSPVSTSQNTTYILVLATIEHFAYLEGRTC